MINFRMTRARNAGTFRITLAEKLEDRYNYDLLNILYYVEGNRLKHRFGKAPNAPMHSLAETDQHRKGRLIGRSTAVTVYYENGRCEKFRLVVARVIWVLRNGSIDPNLFVDHVDGDAGNNAPENHRLVTVQENNHNRRFNTKGYSWNNKDKRYRALIRSKEHGEVYLGNYKTAEEARAAYLAAKSVLHPTTPQDYFEDITAELEGAA